MSYIFLIISIIGIFECGKSLVYILLNYFLAPEEYADIVCRASFTAASGTAVWLVAFKKILEGIA